MGTLPLALLVFLGGALLLFLAAVMWRRARRERTAAHLGAYLRSLRLRPGVEALLNRLRHTPRPPVPAFRVPAIPNRAFSRRANGHRLGAPGEAPPAAASAVSRGAAGRVAMIDEPQTSPRRARFARRVPARGPNGALAESLHEALAELVLLREENARLSAAVHEPPSLGRLVARARALATASDGRDDGDEVAQMLTDGVVLRESLLAVCREMERSVAAVKARLDGVEHETSWGSPAGG